MAGTFSSGRVRRILIPVGVFLTGLAVLGVPIARLAPLALLLACPMMMLGMHGSHGADDHHPVHERDARVRRNGDPVTRERIDPATRDADR